MAVNNRMVLLSSKDTGNAATELIASGGDNNILVGELAINTNDGVLFAGCDPDNASATIGGKVPAAADVLAMTLSTAATTQAVGTGASPSFAGLTSTGTFTHDSVGISAVQTSAESFADNNTSIMTSAAILDKIQAESGTATNATNSSHVLVTDNESTNEENLITFVENATDSTGNVGLEMDGTLTYNPSSGTVTATAFAGNLTGNVTGNTSGSSGSTTGNAATATALANARTIGGTSFDGTANIAVNLAATATALATARTIGGTSFDGTGNITPANATLAAEATALENARTIAGVSFDGTANISLNNNAITNGAGYVTANDDVSVANLKTALAGGFASNAVTIGDSNDVVTIGNDLTVTGDLIVSGDTVTVNTATLSVEDPLIYMAKNQTGSGSVDIGLIGERGDDTNVGIIFDESANVWSAITTTDTGTTAGNVSIADYADFRAGTITSDDGFAGALTGNVTGNASGSSGSCTGNAATATALATARTIGGTSFDGTANIAVGLAGTATALATARTIGGVSFDGTSNISLVSGSIPDNAADTTGNAATSTKITSITNSNIVQLTDTQTLTNKTLTGGQF